jgi:Xaa-Pro aminopeptidase
MIKKNAILNKSFISFCLMSFFVTAVPFINAKSNNETAPKAIRVTPPAPKFSDSERLAELAARRAKVFAEMKDNSMMILMSAAPKVYTNDVDFLYRQENNLYYLTNLKQQNATLVLIKNGSTTQEVLFLPARDPRNETWNGKMYSNADATNISGVKTVLDATEYENFFNLLKLKQPFNSKGFAFTPTAENLYLLTPEYEYESEDTREYQREWDLARSLAKISTDEKTNLLKYEPTGNYKIISANPIFAKLRLVKSQYEIQLIQHAIDITTEAQMRAMATSKQVKMEYETQAEIEYVFRRRNADYWGYPSIVGCGPNATTLHYEESQGEVKQGNLLLMDVGAEYDHLTADVTRTFPVNGKFTKEQAEVYQIVYDAQEAAAKIIKPGVKYSEPSKAAKEVIEAGLAKLGLITAVGATIPGVFEEYPDGKGGVKKVPVPQYRLWYMHGWGHWLGMNVHDVGGGGNTILQPGMITTNEPGIYVREDALSYLDTNKPETKAWLEKIRPAYEKYKNIGVRIEDDMLVTPTGAEWLTKNLPRKISDIEDFMANASNEIKIASLKNNNIQNLAVYRNY